MYCVCLLISFLMSSCKTTQDISKIDEWQKVVEMYKGPCYGRCPVFTFTIYDNQMATYRGKQFTDREGLYTKTLTPETYKKVVNAFSAANMWEFEDFYKSQIPDAATVTLTYVEDGQEKTVKGKENRPKEIRKLEQMLDSH